MSTPADPQSPPAPTGAPETTPSVPEPPAPTGGAPEPTPAPATAPTAEGLPGAPAPDGVVVSGRGSNQDRPPAPASSPSSQAPEGQPPAPAADGQKIEDLPDWAQRVIKEAREDAGKARVNAKNQAAEEARKQMAQDIGRALGIITDDTPPEEQLTPDQLRDLLQGERTTAKMARTELAVYRAAQSGTAFNAAALLDSRTFLDSIKDVDPTDSEALATKIAEAVQAQPWLAAPAADPAAPAAAPQQGAAPVAPVQPPAPVPVAVPPSGGQFAGGPGAQPTDYANMSIDDFRKLRRSPRS